MIRVVNPIPKSFKADFADRSLDFISVVPTHAIDEFLSLSDTLTGILCSSQPERRLAEIFCQFWKKLTERLSRSKDERIALSMVKNAVRMIDAVCHAHSDKMVKITAITACHCIFGFLTIQNLDLPRIKVSEISPQSSQAELASYLLDHYVDPAVDLAFKLEHEAALEVNYAEDGSEPGTGEEDQLGEDSDFPVSSILRIKGCIL